MHMLCDVYAFPESPFARNFKRRIADLELHRPVPSPNILG